MICVVGCCWIEKMGVVVFVFFCSDCWCGWFVFNVW